MSDGPDMNDGARFDHLGGARNFFGWIGAVAACLALAILCVAAGLWYTEAELR